MTVYIFYFHAVMMGDFFLAAMKCIAMPKYSSLTRIPSSL